ncbi:MAG TPA: hypothetical protein EYP35_08090 [Desulfobacterales bacterium]|nr:hypothetical protein [Desulfobacterales bacterium]HIP39938.1 hypothetical protein [Desulfocapsa sulfexigens]
MTILYHDTNWLVVNKPSGISTHRAHEGDTGLVEWLSLHHDLQVHTCSRLDKGTSGVVVFALTREAVTEAQLIHENDRAQKIYFFIARKSSRTTWVSKEPLDGKSCKTVFDTVQEGTVYNLYKAVIHRGRTHQIRRHAADSGIPLLGDELYGGPPFVRLCLHCNAVDWPEIDQRLEAELPKWFKTCLNGPTEEITGLALADKRYPFLTSVSDCCRLIHRGEYSEEDIAIDKYGEWLCVTGYDESTSAKQLLRRLRTMLSALSVACNCRGGVVKTSLRDPHKRQLFADFARWGETVPEPFLVREHDLHFSVRLNDHQHVGLFLDQRDSRSRIAEIAKNKRVANLFAFTCSFSIYALHGGAEVVFSVDLAAGCLKQGRENVAINQLASAGNAKFIKEDVRKWLARQLRKKQNDPHHFVPFDVVICDPPVFASSGKKKSFHVEKEWLNLASNVWDILAQNGTALFSNNHQQGSGSHYFDILQQQFSRVTSLNPPLDFPQIAGRPSHVRIYWCEK